MTDQEHANAVTEAAGALNRAIHAAAVDGLTVSLGTLEINRIRHAEPVPMVEVGVARRIEPET